MKFRLSLERYSLASGEERCLQLTRIWPVKGCGRQYGAIVDHNRQFRRLRS